MHLDLCNICWGISPDNIRCMFCKKKMSDHKLTCDLCGVQQKDHGNLGHRFNNLHHESQINHTLYLKRIHNRLRHFKMLTSGVWTIDEQLTRMWGPWREMTAAESYARDVMRGKQFPEYLRGTDLGGEIEVMVSQLCHDSLIGEFNVDPNA